VYFDCLHHYFSKECADHAAPRPSSYNVCSTCAIVIRRLAREALLGMIRSTDWRLPIIIGNEHIFSDEAARPRGTRSSAVEMPGMLDAEVPGMLPGTRALIAGDAAPRMLY